MAQIEAMQDIGPILAVCPGPNSQVLFSLAAGNAPSVPPGSYINRVTVHQQVAISIGGSRGEIYCAVSLERVSNTTPTTGRALAGLWRGQVTDFERNPPSTPNIYCGGSGYFIRAAVQFGSNRVAGDVVEINIEVSDHVIGGTWIQDESPIDRGRRGFFRTISLGDPAAGANYTAVGVPSFVQWKIIGFAGPIVKSAVAAIRQPFMDLSDGANIYGGSVGNGDSTISNTQNDRMGIGAPAGPVGGGNPGVGQGWGVPEDTYLRTGHQITIGQRNIDVGDNWGPGFLGVEEFASP